jgi:hypothetical protein
MNRLSTLAVALLVCAGSVHGVRPGGRSFRPGARVR